ncbi:MAG: HigA family addiction module antidote protein [Candidatus Moeniiplasma glomeromycotorum]|nr:HigA family addiction module antidote protein [Candidatus Moeniiplasma glomeromycotorum]MCE8167576.1 HigA family addiction module antidote protein [Candidatus Moeniiplasma glomeromycotorum]MCE8169072.1 HigA family addiction module antidote protein [Candidatus Moeniiplasma glomeromycotorum]
MNRKLEWSESKSAKQPIIVHPGEVLRESFLTPLKLTSEKLAKNIKVDPKIIKELVAEKRDLDKELATRLALYFDMSTEFWLGIQHDYEQDCLENLRANLSKEIVPLRTRAR